MNNIKNFEDSSSPHSQNLIIYYDHLFNLLESHYYHDQNIS